MKLVTQTIVSASTPTNVPTNRIVVVDCSGSMSSELPKLRTHLKNKLPTMVQPQDSLTLMWFSGSGQFGTIFEDIQISTATDLSKINTAIDRFLNPVGLTGFADPLNEVKRLVQKSGNEAYTLSFMSDGYDNCSSKSVILQICAELGELLASATFVEYGYYSDHDLLVKMAEEVGGAVVQATDFTSYSDELTSALTSTVAKSRITVTVPQLSDGYNFVVGTSSSSFVISVPKDGKVSLPGTVTEYSYFTGSGQVTEITSRPAACYMVSALIQRSQADTALDLASVIGSTELYHKVENSFSKQDYARTVEISNAFGSGSKELGSAVKIKNSPNAYNVLTMLMDLAAEGNYIHIGHREFTYNRIGSSTEKYVPEDGEFVPEFTDKSADIKAPILSLKFDEDRPNVSILVKRPGSVTLGPNSLGFGPSIESFIFRSYSIVRDGIVNVTKLPVVVTKATYDILFKNKAITEPFLIGKTYVIDMTQFPVINRAMATVTDSTTLFNKVFKLYTLRAAQKYLKTKFEKPEVSEGFTKIYGEEGAKFLKENGITEAGFSQKTGKTIKIDSYTAKVLEIKLSSLSSIPKVDDVVKAMGLGKSLTPSQKVLSDYIGLYSNFTEEQAKEEFVKIKALIEALRNEIVIAKFGIILGKKWFTDMTSYDDNVRELDFSLGKPIKCQAILSDMEV